MYDSESHLNSTPSGNYYVPPTPPIDEEDELLETMPPLPPWQVEVTQELMDIVTSLVFESGISKYEVKSRLLLAAGKLVVYTPRLEEIPQSPWIVPF